MTLSFIFFFFCSRSSNLNYSKLNVLCAWVCVCVFVNDVHCTVYVSEVFLLLLLCVSYVSCGMEWSVVLMFRKYRDREQRVTDELEENSLCCFYCFFFACWKCVCVCSVCVYIYRYILIYIGKLVAEGFNYNCTILDTTFLSLLWANCQ